MAKTGQSDHRQHPDGVVARAAPEQSSQTIAGIARIVVVTGCQRSGSTLVGQIIGAHPQALLIDEPDGLYDWFDAHARGSRDAAARLHRMLTRANAKYRGGHRRIALHGVDRAPVIHPAVTHLVLKAPNLAFDYGRLARLALPVTVVFPIRDPRAVVASMLRLRHIPMVRSQIELIRRHRDLAAALSDELAFAEDETHSPEARSAMVWKIKSLLHERFTGHDLPTLTVRYEDLVADTTETCWRIADHVGLSRHPRMLAHEEVFQGFGPGFTERSRPVDRLSLDTWRPQLSAAQQEEILAVAGDAMTRLGFTRNPAPADDDCGASVAVDTLRGPVILTGHGGSGTRIVAEIASSGGLFTGNRQNASHDSIEWLDLICAMAVDRALTDAGDPASPPPDWSHALLARARGVLAAGRRQAGGQWGLKLPEAMLVVPELFAFFSEARLVHLVRHPVDCSLRGPHMTARPDNPWGSAVLRAAYRAAGLDPALIDSHGDHIRNALSWRYQVQRVMTFGRQRLPAERYLEIRYEDLCTDPHAASHRLLDFIGLAPDDAEPPAIDSNRMRNYSPSDPRIAEIWEICEETALELGYGPAG